MSIERAESRNLCGIIMRRYGKWQSGIQSEGSGAFLRAAFAAGVFPVLDVSAGGCDHKSRSGRGQCAYRIFAGAGHPVHDRRIGRRSHHDRNGVRQNTQRSCLVQTAEWTYDGGAACGSGTCVHASVRYVHIRTSPESRSASFGDSPPYAFLQHRDAGGVLHAKRPTGDTVQCIRELRGKSLHRGKDTAYCGFCGRIPEIWYGGSGLGTCRPHSSDNP